MNPKRVLDLLGRLAILKFFPSSNVACMEALLSLVGDMCNSEAEVEWLVKRMTSGLYAEWPGPQEMRAVLCSRFPPKDGINAYSTVYLDGIPASKENRLEIAAAQQKLLPLPEGRIASVDKSLESGVHILVTANKLMNTMGGPATPEEILDAPQWLRQLTGHS